MAQIYARSIPPVERMQEIQRLVRDPKETSTDVLKAAELLKQAQKPAMYTPRSLAEAASKARLPVPERQRQQAPVPQRYEQQVPQQRQAITEEDERILTAQGGGQLEGAGMDFPPTTRGQIDGVPDYQWATRNPKGPVSPTPQYIERIEDYRPKGHPKYIKPKSYVEEWRDKPRKDLDLDVKLMNWLRNLFTRETPPTQEELIQAERIKQILGSIQSEGEGGLIPRQAGGRAAIPQQIENVASKGRHGDTMLMHVNPDELRGLSSLLGPTTTNPDTGLPEAFAWWLPLIGAAIGGIGAAATGGDWKKGLLYGGLAGLGGAFMAPGAAASSAIPGMVSGTGTVVPGSMATIGAAMPGAIPINPAVLAGGIPGAGSAITGATAIPPMGSLAPWQQMMLGGTSHAPAIASQALTPLAGQAGQMQNILGAAKGLGPAADSIYTLGGKQVAPELLQQSGLAPWQPQPLKQQPSLFKQGLNYITGSGGDETVKGSAGSDMFGGIKEWWEPKSKLEKGAYVAGGAGLLGLAAQPPQQQFAELPTRKVSEFTFEDDVIEKDPRVPRTFTQEALEERIFTGLDPEDPSYFEGTSFAKEGGLLSVIKRLTGGRSNIPEPGGAAHYAKYGTWGGPAPGSAAYYGRYGTFGVQDPYNVNPLALDPQRNPHLQDPIYGLTGASVGNDSVPVSVPFEFPEVTPFQSSLPSFNLEDRLTSITGQSQAALPQQTTLPQQATLPSIPITDTQGASAMENLLSRFQQTAQVDPIAGLVASQVGVKQGGIPKLANGGIFTGHVQGVGDGMSDQIPFRVVPRTPEDIPKAPDMAVLSTDEYVFPADAVSMLGNGSSDAGAKILDNAVKSVRQASIGTPKQITEIDGPKVLGGALTT